MSIETITFEQPVNEHTRACLRLEQLFQQLAHCLGGPSVWDSRSALAAIIDILNILDRPDLKTKLTKELCRHLANLARLEQTPHVDRKKLSVILIELEDIIDGLQSVSGRIAQDLRGNDFLTSVRQHLLNPGGICHFDVPAYHDWLQKPSAERVANLNQWYGRFSTIQAAVNLLLRLIRDSSQAQSKVAQEGFFQMPLDAQIPCQLIQVTLSTHESVYPVISVGRYGVAIQFFILNLKDRPTQTTEDVPFKLTCCIM
jgi:cell division protein ZapD